MKKSIFGLFFILLTLVLIGFSVVKATPLYDSKEVVNLYTQLEEKYVNSLTKFDWVYVITQTEIKDELNTTREDWYGLLNGSVDKVYEWTTFDDQVNVSQISMLDDGIWYNTTLNQKWSARSNNLIIASEFSEGLMNALTIGGKVGIIEDVFDSKPIYIFSYEYDVNEKIVESNIYGSLISVRNTIFIDKETGKPFKSELFFLYENGYEVLQRLTLFTVETGGNPPIEIISDIQSVVEKEGLTYEWKSEVGAKYLYYQTKYRSESVTVSGLAITSYKQILIRPDYWTGNLYTGVGSGILQEVGANWYSIQEYCNGSTINRSISTTPVVLYGRANWYKTSGSLAYLSGCSLSHEVYVNGSHYAKYNYTVMTPSPNFSIWWPAP